MTGDEMLGGGVYVLIRSGEVVYVGQSNCMLRRIAKHLSDGAKNFDDFECEYVPEHLRREAEETLISFYCPEYNVALSGRGEDRYAMLLGKCRRAGLSDEIAEIVFTRPREVINADS